MNSMKKILTTTLLLALGAVLWTTGCQQTSQQRRPTGYVQSRPEPAPAPAPATRQNCSDPTRGLVSLGKQMPKEVTLGENFQYDLSMASQDCVDNVVVVDHVPAGASYVKSEPAAEVSGDVLTWKLKEMEAGQKGVIHV